MAEVVNLGFYSSFGLLRCRGGGAAGSLALPCGESVEGHLGLTCSSCADVRPLIFAIVIGGSSVQAGFY